MHESCWEFRKILIWGGGEAMHMRERFFFFLIDWKKGVFVFKLCVT